MRIGFIKGYALGDVVRCTSIVRKLVQQYPEAEIVWFTSFEAVTLIDHFTPRMLVVQISDNERIQSLPDFDWVISLDEELCSAALATRLKTRKLSGAYLARDGTVNFTDDLEAWFGMGLLGLTRSRTIADVNLLKQDNDESCLSLLYRGLGLPLPIHRPVIRVSAAERLQARRSFLAQGVQDGERPIGLFLGGSSRWGRKPWLPAQVRDILEGLMLSFDQRFAIVGGPTEAKCFAELKAIRFSQYSPIIVEVDSVRMMAATVSEFQLLVTTDSLPMHLAIAAGVPVIALFGPTSAAEIDVFDKGAKIETALTCRRCYLRKCEQREDCRDGISVERIEAATRDILSRAAPRPEWKHPSDNNPLNLFFG